MTLYDDNTFEKNTKPTYLKHLNKVSQTVLVFDIYTHSATAGQETSFLICRNTYMMLAELFFIIRIIKIKLKLIISLFNVFRCV